MYNRLLSQIVVLLLSLFLNHSVSAVEARYVKILMDRTKSAFCNGVISISDLQILDYLGDDLIKKTTVLTSAASVDYSRSFGSNCVVAYYPIYAIDSDTTTAYVTPNGSGISPIGSEWLLVDLRQNFNIKQISLSTLYGKHGSVFYSSLVDYRIVVSLDGLRWSLAAVVVDQPVTSRTDIVTLEDLGGGMDIDIWLVFTFILIITVFAFYRQIFF